MKILQQPTKSTTSACGACRNGEAAPFPFTMAFQPIVDAASRTVFAYEALVRGPQNESAYSVLSQVTEENRYSFDQFCRVKAIELASKLELTREGASLSLNFMPNAVYSPSACIQRTLRAARDNGFPLDHLIFELTEDERVSDTAHLRGIVDEYRRHGFSLALDDFGAGYSGLNLLTELQVNILKFDALLIRNIQQRPRAEASVRAIADLCKTLGVRVVAEAVETREEYRMLRACGIELMQGYLFAQPAFEALPAIEWPQE